MPLDGSAPPRELGTIAPATANGLMEWTAEGSGILFSTVERTNVWLQPLSGERAGAGHRPGDAGHRARTPNP